MIPPRGPEVLLGVDDELLCAAQVGVRRRIESLASRYQGRFSDGTEWTNDIEGSAAELANAKYANQYWTGLARRADGDVGELQVRWTNDLKKSLIVRPYDLRDGRDPYIVFVIGCDGRYRLDGYIRASDAQRAEWWRDPDNLGGAWFVPRSALLEIQ